MVTLSCCIRFIRERWRRCFLVSAIRSWLEQGCKRCNLCRTLLEKEAWVDGEHRRTCSSEHAEQLRQMPTSHREWGPKMCLKCEEFMRVWPEEEGEEFQCDNNRMCRYSEGGVVVNRGEPPWMKFSCFTCDINFCSTCVLAETTTTNGEDTILDITTEDLDPIPGSIPWVPSAPPDDTKSDKEKMNLPSYQEAIGP